jgi:ABC-2 type transport system permease protein
MLAIFQKEINHFLSSLTAYLTIGIFLMGTGLLVWVFPDTNLPDASFADLSPLFTVAPWVLMFLIPAVTMRTFAEEQKAGTLEWLLTKPLTGWQIVLGKYLAAWLLSLLALLPTWLYVYSVWQLGSPAGNLDLAGTVGSYLGLASLAAVFTAAGVLASALTNSQVVAFVLAAALCFVLYQGLGLLAGLEAWGSGAFFLQQISLDSHYQSLSRGLIDSRDVVYFVSVTAILLLATRLRLQSRQW